MKKWLSREIIVLANDCLPLHRHRWHSKTIIILEGLAMVTCEGTTKKCQSGDSINVAKNMAFRVDNLSDSELKLLEVSFSEANKPWFLDEDYILEE